VRLALAALLLVPSGIGCGGEPRSGGGAAPPPGAGYDAPAAAGDLRPLSKDDCLALRDHQLDIAVAAALGEQATDPAARLEVEAKVRAQMKSETDAWVKRCSGRRIRVADYRCMKDASTPDAFVACGAATNDAGVDARVDAGND
jgi:hypothetical protein